MSNQKIQILDCTIRDGSYLINYQFTAEDTFVIARALVEAGIGRIEVGHGVGLDAQYAGKGRAAQSDTEYIRAAKDAVGDRAKVGCFFIPGIGSLDSIREAADAGLDFIRIGTNIVDYREAEEPIRLARDLGLEVWSNLMKSYLVGPEEFARIGREVAGFGAQVVVLVDSAGGFTPDNVRDYAEAASAEVPVPLGFHGHNNLQLAIANCLAFAKSGGAFLDGSLRGMGRSAGNAATELLCALLAREGYDLGGIDWRLLMRIAQEMIAPIMPRDIGLLPAEIASGLNFFHSSFMPVVEQASQTVSVDPFETIVELDVASRRLVSAEDAAAAANRAAKRTKRLERVFRPKRLPRARWFHEHAMADLKQLEGRLLELIAKTTCEPVITLARPRRVRQSGMRIGMVDVERGYCLVHIESPSMTEDKEIFRRLSSLFRYWVSDWRIAPVSNCATGQIWLHYDDDAVIARGLASFFAIMDIRGSVFLPASSSRLGRLVRLMVDADYHGSGPYEALIGINTKRPIMPEDLDYLKQGGYVVAALPDAVLEKTVEEAHRRSIQLWRLDLRHALTAAVSELLAAYDVYHEHAGWVSLGDFNIVAGGVLGRRGDIVVDSIVRPHRVFGTADGRGAIENLSAADPKVRRQVFDWMLATIWQGTTKRGT